MCYTLSIDLTAETDIDTPTMTERCEECGTAIHLPNDLCDDCAMSTAGASDWIYREMCVFCGMVLIGSACDCEMWEFVYGGDAR